MNETTPREPSSLRLALTVAVAGLASGLLLAAVYEVTDPIIKANQAAALRRAVFKVVPGSKAMQAVEGEDIFAAYDAQDNFVGYAIRGEGPGFQDAIKLLYGYDPQRKQVVGMEILESRETPGLGDKIFKDAGFVGDFAALSIQPEIVLVKPGKKENANEVDAITGATISSRAVVKIINQANARWLKQLPPPGSEPARNKEAQP